LTTCLVAGKLASARSPAHLLAATGPAMIDLLALVTRFADSLGTAPGKGEPPIRRDFVAELGLDRKGAKASSRGDLLFGDGRYNEAYKAYEIALRRCRAATGATPLDVAILLYNPGAAACEAGRLELAAACGRAALQEIEKHDARGRPGIDPSRCREHVEQLMALAAAPPPAEPDQAGKPSRLKPLPSTW
jgi:tetratricopeptide (TPR) repeat protein